MALWRQQVDLHPTFASINGCLKDDWFLLPYELRLQRAHAHALAAAGILTAAEIQSIEQALVLLESRWRDQPSPESPEEDIHTWIEQQLTQLAGAAGKKIHTARSRNDQVATSLLMFVLEAGERAIRGLGECIRAAATRAETLAEAAFPLQTHTQFAAPGSVGFWLLCHAVLLDRVRDHFAYFVSCWRQHCPLGSGAVAGSSISVDRSIQARELGFTKPSPNALASTGTREECMEFLFLASQIAQRLQAFAVDVIAFAQTPFGWIVYPTAFGTGSSMMPNKRNPDAMELLRAECALLAGAHPQATLLTKGLPSGYNRDLQVLKPVVRDGAARLERLLSLVAAFIGELAFDSARLNAALELGDVGATLAMERLVLDGTPLRDAHHAVAAQVEGGTLAVNVAAFLESYRTAGSANPAETRRVARGLLSKVTDRTTADRLQPEW